MNIEIDMNELKSVEKIISNLLKESDFYKMNKLIRTFKTDVNSKYLFPLTSSVENAEYISVKTSSLKPFVKVLSENDFYKIVGLTKKGLSKRSRRVQEWLYGHYIEAIQLQDEGYVSDVLYKALEFQTNLLYVKSLMKNKTFAKLWRQEFGSESAAELYKRKGSLKLVNIIKERADVKTE